MTFAKAVYEYDPISGRILTGFQFPSAEHREANRRPNQIDGAYSGDTHYILNEQPTERPTQTTQLTGLTLKGLPNPCVLYIDNTAYPVDDDTVDLDLTLPGAYRLRVEAFPYLDWTGEVVK